MTKYVIGFLFSPSLDRVILIRKKRPEWQAEKWNAPGGKVETGESFIEAVAREFHEETGLLFPLTEWHHFATTHPNKNSIIQTFYTVSESYNDVDTLTDEAVRCWPVAEVMRMPWGAFIPEIPWLVQMGLVAYRDRRHVHLSPKVDHGIYECTWVDPEAE